MGEYAIRKSDRLQVKIGTCEDMYYLRYEDRDNVQYDGSFEGERFRLPFPDEDNIRIGEYGDYERGINLYKATSTKSTCFVDRVDNILLSYTPARTGDEPGLIQLVHESGLLTNVKCYHGGRLPESTDEVKFFWNGRTPVNFELRAVKPLDGKMWAVFGCRWCRRMWRVEIPEILEYIPDEILRERISKYTETEGVE